MSALRMEQIQTEVVGLKKLLETYVEENEVIKRELTELRKVCAQGERVHQAEMFTLKNDLERLKKTQPDFNPGGQSGQPNSGLPSTDIYTRVKGMKKRPQSVHEITILPLSIQGHLQANKAHENGSNDSAGVGGNSLGLQLPFYFTLYNFDHCMKNKLKCFSEPFYSHCNGYKLCIGVDVAGMGEGEGTHVSLNVHILRGEFDDKLQWPFRGTVRLLVLNERRDCNHFEAAVEFTDDTPLVNSARVTCSDMSTGWGNALLMPHSQLTFNSATDCELVKYNRLRFAVTEVEVTN